MRTLITGGTLDLQTPGCDPSAQIYEVCLYQDKAYMVLVIRRPRDGSLLYESAEMDYVIGAGKVLDDLLGSHDVGYASTADEEDPGPCVGESGVVEWVRTVVIPAIKKGHP